MGDKINLLISVEQPSAEKSAECKPSLFQKVKYAVDCMQGDYNTARALAYIAKVYLFINKIPCEEHTPIQKKVMRMIIPELEFHAPHLLDSKTLVAYKQDRDWTENPDIAPDYLRGR